jgi:glyoxylase I family protein
MFIGLEHTAIASPAPEKLAQWYVDHLGFRHIHNYDGNYFVRAANQAVLEIIPSVGARADQKERDPGIRHLAIQVSDFDAAYAGLRARGVNFINEPYMLGTNRLVFFTDCDGNLVHLIQREKQLPS